MSTFALIHGAGVGGGWFWHLVEAELQALGHTTELAAMLHSQTGEKGSTR